MEPPRSTAGPLIRGIDCHRLVDAGTLTAVIHRLGRGRKTHRQQHHQREAISSSRVQVELLSRQVEER